jgi:putative ABC transport system ATP-binding protein
MSMTTRRGEHDAVADTSATPSAAVAECANVSRIFGAGASAVHAVREVSCRISPWARIALTGPSGSGKTTLLHLIAGLDTPTTGSLRWPALSDGRRGRRPPGIGVVFQGPSLLPSLDVTENVSLPLMFAGQPHDIAMGHARAALDLVGISDLAAKLPDELSGGQSQRAAIARVLAARPALILADEPTGRLDHHTAHRVITVLLDTAFAIGAAVIISTHDPLIAARLPDRWVMRDGRLDTHPTTEGRVP